MQLIDSIKSLNENVYKLVFNGIKNIPLEVSYIRKNDGKDILVVPTQSSCSMGCSFCHLTGLNIPATNLSSEEILDLVKSSLKFQCPDNPALLISFMGAGEPLLNVSNIITAAKLIKSIPEYTNIRFAVSTIIPSIKQFNEFTQQVIESKLPFKLHWSLHTTKQEARKSLMPSALNLNKSVELLNNYMNLTGNAVEIHYTLMKNVNDTDLDAENISKLIDKRMIIKLLKFAPKEDLDIEESERTIKFKEKLEDDGFIIEVYSPPGRDIGSSCGMFIVDQYIK